MTFGSKFWRLAIGAFTFINVAGLAYAVAEEEEMHAMLHLFLLLLALAAYVGWRVARRAQPATPPQGQLPEARIEYLQQSVDAMALELERIGEAQRFNDKLRAERGETPPPKKDQ